MTYDNVDHELRSCPNVIHRAHFTIQTWLFTIFWLHSLSRPVVGVQFKRLQKTSLWIFTVHLSPQTRLKKTKYKTFDQSTTVI